MKKQGFFAVYFQEQKKALVLFCVRKAEMFLFRRKKPAEH